MSEKEKKKEKEREKEREKEKKEKEKREKLREKDKVKLLDYFLHYCVCFNVLFRIGKNPCFIKFHAPTKNCLL